MSLYLGTIGSDKGVYEVHAFTSGLPFRFFSSAMISDTGLYKSMLEERFKLLQDNKPIYCTAVSPDVVRKIEYNPHDDREGTVHVATIDKNTGKICCILSVAIDTGEKENGNLIGLPLENRWGENGYPEGASLDNFRADYPAKNLGVKESIKPWQLAELYRHFKINGNSDDPMARLGIYVGLYDLLVREPRNLGMEETFIWVFDTIPEYFRLYRFAGAAVLREPTLEERPRYLSPGIEEIKEGYFEGERCLFYNKEVISRNVIVPIPLPNLIGGLECKKTSVPFLDGVINIHNIEDAARKNPLDLSTLKYEGITDQDMGFLKVALSIFGKKYYAQTFADNQEIIASVEAKRNLISPIWDFNEIGA